MTATASDPWFWNDYQGDPCLRSCSLAAQGVWMRLLCIMAEAKPKGFLLINGKKPDPDQLARVVGGHVSEVSPLVEELIHNGVCSMTRVGVIFCRRMVRDAKRKAASAKGGRIGGRVTHSKGSGIFGTQGATQDATSNTIPFPTHSHGKKESKKGTNSKNTMGENGSGNGRNHPDFYRIKDPAERMNRFAKTIAENVPGGVGQGWTIVFAAQNANDPNHATALEICQRTAKRLGKGWPSIWPIKGGSHGEGTA